ncbi:hypothetical protein TRVA0_040S00980 [Trichomonascus vanleenenianus]|uniref:uncharacterized protein n=1 Tax=Trichomonascus vanleenenianus TaxID=2268995 RepID=UPI003ECB4E8F
MRYLFSATTTEIDHIFRVVKAIGQVAPIATVTFTHDSVQIFVGKYTQTCQAHLILDRALFSNYEFNPAPNQENHSVRVPMKNLIMCFQLFRGANLTEEERKKARHGGRSDTITASTTGASASFVGTETSISAVCNISMEESDSRVFVSFKENNMVTVCTIDTVDNLEEEAFDPIELDRESIVLEAIFSNGSELYGILSEFEALAPSRLMVRAQSCNSPRFFLNGEGDHGHYTFVLPEESSLIESFVVKRPGIPDSDVDTNENVTVKNVYGFGLFKLIFEMLCVSSKVKLRTDSDGLLSFLCLCPSSSQLTSVEFIYLPLEEDI